MLLKEHNNSVTVETAGRFLRAACWQSSSVVVLGITPSKPFNSLMLRDKGQQPRYAESLVGGYLFNQHR